VVVKIIFIALFVIAAVGVFAACKPDTIRIERAITINAPPEKVFGLIDDFHNWGYWAPQDREDATLQRTYSGPASGPGSKSAWAGSGGAGSGSMEIVEASRNRTVAIKVDFLRPFEAHNTNEFTLQQEGASTVVTWKMQGTNPYIAKVMSVFVSMDRVVGAHFETGLRNLKAAAEK